MSTEFRNKYSKFALILTEDIMFFTYCVLAVLSPPLRRLMVAYYGNYADITTIYMAVKNCTVHLTTNRVLRI